MLDRMTSVAEQYGCLRKLRSPMLTGYWHSGCRSCTWVTRSRDVAGDPAAKALRIACRRTTRSFGVRNDRSYCASKCQQRAFMHPSGCEMLTRVC